jgi:hypothetical protein
VNIVLVKEDPGENMAALSKVVCPIWKGKIIFASDKI